MSASTKLLLYLHSSAIATLLCTLLIAACADPVGDAIKTAEKFSAAKDFTEAMSVLNRATFKTPEEKKRIEDAKERVLQANRLVFYNEAITSAESLWPNLPAIHPFRGMGAEQRYFTPELALRYNRLVMQANVPVEACLARKREDSYLLCERPLEYVRSAELVATLVSHMKVQGERGNVAAAHCILYFALGSLLPTIGDQAANQAASAQLFKALDALREKLKLTEQEFLEQARRARSGCTPDVVFGKI